MLEIVLSMVFATIVVLPLLRYNVDKYAICTENLKDIEVERIKKNVLGDFVLGENLPKEYSIRLYSKTITYVGNVELLEETEKFNKYKVSLTPKNTKNSLGNKVGIYILCN